MPTPTFIQIHTLISYGPSLLNRDENGMAKRITFGGTVRTRISSQCIKRHLRMAKGRYALSSVPGVTESVRSRNTIDRLVIQPFRDTGEHDSEVMDALQNAFNMNIYTKTGLKQEDRQPLLLGLPEVDYFKQKVEDLLNQDLKDPDEIANAVTRLFSRNGEESNFKAMMEAIRLPAGLTAALFGRMVTSDFASNIDGSIHVSHPFTVHRQETTMDYFSVVEDLQTTEESAGAAHLNQSELSTGLYYGYIVVDVPALVSNLEGCPAQEWLNADHTMAAAVVKHLLHSITQVSPGAKMGSTAPHSYADLLLVEASDRQPRGLYNAYREPVASSQTKDAVQALASYMQRMDNRYGQEEIRRVLRDQDMEIPGSPQLSMNDMADWTSDRILQAGTE